MIATDREFTWSTWSQALGPTQYYRKLVLIGSRLFRIVLFPLELISKVTNNHNLFINHFSQLLGRLALVLT